MRSKIVLALMTGWWLAPTPTSADEKPAAFGEGWKATIPMPEGLWGEPGRFVVWVEGGWLQVRRETAEGERDWQVVLARATDPRPPLVVAPGKSPKESPRFEVSYRDGRYFVREDLWVLRAVRERKPEGGPWPALTLDAGRRAGMGWAGDSPRAFGGKVGAWFVVTSGPSEAKQDSWLRLSPAKTVDEGGCGFGSFGSMRRVLAGPDWVLDDGEMLMASRGAVAVEYNRLVAGDLAPPLLAKTLDGKPFDLNAYKGKYVLLDFWATWCGPCVAELPRLQDVHEVYGRDGQFALVSLTLDDEVAAPMQFAKDKGMPWTQVFLGDKPGQEVLKNYGVESIPATVLIGPDGKVIETGMRGESIRKAVGKALIGR